MISLAKLVLLTEKIREDSFDKASRGEAIEADDFVDYKQFYKIDLFQVCIENNRFGYNYNM